MIKCDFQKLELFGTDYLFDLAHEMRKDEVSRIYIAESAKAIIELIGKVFGAKITYPSLIAMLCPKEREPEKTPEQIIDEVTKNAGLEVIDDG